YSSSLFCLTSSLSFPCASCFADFRCSFFLSILPRPPKTTLFPYTTLFRSWKAKYSAGVGPSTQPLLDREKATQKKIFTVKIFFRSEEHTSELQSRFDLVCRLLLEKKKKKNK